MKKWMAGGLVLAALLPAAQGQWEKHEDTSAPVALVTLADASRWQAGLAYAHVSRTVELDARESRLQGDVADIFLGFSVAPWLQLYGQAGVSRARIDDLLNPRPGAGAGGLLGARLDLWQYHAGHPETSWRFTIPLDARIAHRTTDDKGAGEIRWTEILVAMPLDYHLTFAHNSRNFYMSEFHSLRLYAGPAFSDIDGTWEAGGTRRDFEESESLGAVAGAELWLLENVSFGARADWFDSTTLHLTVRYRF
ncbi:MAG TPA: hypothetical protein PLJ99_06370 [Kiritimatiellia bacterium]|nr:hypothetical protein [Kiritimatiellia bacterium]HPR68898.1 hypothetical protein [Kiritimatiellia bacterium]HRX06350.1 hypothetical protein [Kiritimatiellia bacterium]